MAFTLEGQADKERPAGAGRREALRAEGALRETDYHLRAPLHKQSRRESRRGTRTSRGADSGAGDGGAHSSGPLPTGGQQRQGRGPQVGGPFQLEDGLLQMVAGAPQGPSWDTECRRGWGQVDPVQPAGARYLSKGRGLPRRLVTTAAQCWDARRCTLCWAACTTYSSRVSCSLERSTLTISGT